MIERNNMTLDGAGYAVQGPRPLYGVGINVTGSNVTIKNMTVKSFTCGILLSYYSNYNSVSGNNITAHNYDGIWLVSSSSNSISGNSITARAQIHVTYILAFGSNWISQAYRQS